MPCPDAWGYRSPCRSERRETTDAAPAARAPSRPSQTAAHGPAQRAASLERSSTEQQRWDRAQQNLHVEPEAPALDIVQIHQDALVKRNVAAAACLPKARQP